MTYIKTINYYTNLITQTMKQSFLDKHLDERELDIHKIIALDQLVQGKTDDKVLVQTTMLVQLALNTHDKIAFSFSDNNIKKQQLTVLAGDYYSGIYYYILANHNNLPFIRVLADGINEMTQAKMNLYYTEYHELDDFLYEFKAIECKLIEKVAGYVEKAKYLPYLTSWLLAKRLEFELVQAHKGEETFLRNIIMSNVQTIRDRKQFVKQLHQSLLNCNQELDTITTENKENTLLPKDLDLFQYSTIKDQWNMVLEEGLS